MRRFNWPRTTAHAVKLVPRTHPNIQRVAGQILDHAAAGRDAFTNARYVEAKFHRDCCGLLLWRLGVDGLTEDDQIRWDGAKYETRLPGRLSSAEARRIRESVGNKAPSALENLVACDHIVPRNCVAEVLLRQWDSSDRETGSDFVIAHAEVAIISPDENEHLKEAGYESRMPAPWWDAPLGEKHLHRMARYQAVEPMIEVTPWPATADG